MEGWQVALVIVVVILLLIFVVGPLLLFGVFAFIGHSFEKEKYYNQPPGYKYDMYDGKVPSCTPPCNIMSKDYLGAEYKGDRGTIQQCQNACDRTGGCNSFTYDFAENRCQLHHLPKGTKMIPSSQPYYTFTGVQAPNPFVNR